MRDEGMICRRDEVREGGGGRARGGGGRARGGGVRARGEGGVREEG